MSKKTKAEKPKKEMTEADENLIKQVIKSASAVLCAVAVSASIITSTTKWSDAMIKAAEASASGGTSQSSSESYSSDSGSDFSQDTAVSEDTSSDSAVDTASEDTPVSSDTDSASENASSSTPAAADTKTEAAKKDSNGAPQTKAEVIAYCNKALNDAKQAKVGYTKTFVRQGGDNLPSIVSSLIKQNKVTKAAKGSADIVDDFPAGGFTWSSKLRESDVQSYDFKQNGQYYEITLKLGKESNPGKGETSAYGRAMTVITEADAKDMLSAVKSANLNYHDGYVYAKIDSKTGKLVKAEFSATADLQGELAVIGSLSANNICSTETFTDIVW